MYVDGYMERKRGYEKLHIAERVNGQRVLREYPPVYEFFSEDPYGDVNTINGTKATRHEFNSYSEMKRAIQDMGNVKLYESDCNVTFKTLSKHYMGVETPVLNTVFFDIETDFHKKFGYAPPNDPFNRVTAISLYQRWTNKDYVLCMAPEGMPTEEAQFIINKINEDTNNPDSIVILYVDEKEMFMDFFSLIEDADVLSGWNSEFFDIPYLVNRTTKLFGLAMTARFCLWNKQPQPREADNFGKTVITYDLVGKVHMDYLALYKKHAGQVEQSYKLDFIGSKVTKENKVQYEGSLDKLYNEDFDTFIRYSKQDSILLKKIDDVLDYINLHNTLAHQECVLISTTMGSVALIDTAIINLIHSKNEVVFDKKPQESDDYDEYYDEENVDYEPIEGEEPEEKVTAKAAGAWVQDPILGMIDWIGCTDFNSLYPTILRTLGMSTECIIGQVRQTYTDAYLADKIDEQKRKFKGKKFVPKWTEAWHGLFSAVEFTKIQDKTDDVLDIDLEDGTSFTTTAKEMHDIIYNPDSTIVLSANGTMFDRTKSGVIPEILTKWYTERKQQQLMVLDYQHLCKDGLELPESCKDLVLEPNGNRIEEHKIHFTDPVFKMRTAMKNSDCEELYSVLSSNGMYIKEGRIFCSDLDKDYCIKHAAFWKQNQQIRKILLNSLYGALLNVSSRFYDKRLGQSVTLTGRSMTKHMACMINEVVTGTYDYTGGAVVYGDTDSVYFSVAEYAKNQGVPFDLTKEEVVELYNDIGNQVGATFPEFMDKTFNTGIEKGKIVGADLEMVGSRGLFLKKKRYAILKYWEDGFRLDEKDGLGKIKAMGLEIKRSDTPRYIQDFLEETLIGLLAGETEQELRARVFKFKGEFKGKPSVEKGSPRTIRKLTTLTEVYNKTGKCHVGHVLAAIQWNRLRELNDDKSVPEATDGTKVIVCKLLPNPLGIKSIGYPIDCAEYLPEWFTSLPFDDDEMEKGVLTKKLDNIFGIVDMDIGINVKSNAVAANDLFDWGDL